ncbi:MAG: phosphomethylpyrimidine synthase, partial [Muribaculaceae bacterium]|nr:phosphomethylpyrimidine synthase [Muribaculaceae bacterium]
MKTITSYPSSEKIYLPGSIYPELRVAMRRVSQHPTVTITDGQRIERPNEPVTLYDTSGPYTDPTYKHDIKSGLPRHRQIWVENREDTMQLEQLSSAYGRMREADTTLDAIRFPARHRPRVALPGKRVTQMHYARKGIITPEMEYVAIRENLDNEARGIKSHITPEFVRDE